VDALGATTTLLVEKMIADERVPNSLEATLLALGIYEDTGSFTYGRTTARDLQAAAWLLAHGAVLDTIRRFLSVPLNDEQQALLEKLLAAGEHRLHGGYAIVVAAARLEKSIVEISRVAQRLGDLLDPSALVCIVETPGGTHLIGRAATDDIDVGSIAAHFGGGGHPRASAATITGKSLEILVREVWEQIEQHTRPAVRVAQLMSHGVQTVEAERPIGEVISQLRRIGHEGYPVIDRGQVVGLLTRRDADRAVEHGLSSLRIREIMQSGAVTVTPDDSVDTLEQHILQSGWGQIPVVDGAGRLIGIVTRTDLIKHWATSHPPHRRAETVIEPQQVRQILGSDVLSFLEQIAVLANTQSLSVFMVGGCVRDLLLSRQNFDLDFVVEGDAIAFARAVAARFGGHISSFPPFGTARWLPDAAALRALGVNALPDHVDFASARNEFYERPTALPTTYGGSIKLDLLRRDFTINTLAMQLTTPFGRIHDYYGGLDDLQSRTIRVLHSLSFIDDPTRILRAVRFAHRLSFAIEARTAALIEHALPMLGKITGERIRNEIELIFREQEPEAVLLALDEMGVLSAIHPALRCDAVLAQAFRYVRTSAPNAGHLPTLPDDAWVMIAAATATDAIHPLCERLLIAGSMKTAMIQAAQLHQAYPAVEALHTPSEIVAYLDSFEVRAVRAVSVVTQRAMMREKLRQYLEMLREVHPRLTGHDLIAEGFKPGPCFQRILKRLRAELLDRIITHEQELERVRAWMREGFCDDDLP
jgi:tRNA nucleotidyltransferase (CCA-adding enzyme)